LRSLGAASRKQETTRTLLKPPNPKKRKLTKQKLAQRLLKRMLRRSILLKQKLRNSKRSKRTPVILTTSKRAANGLPLKTFISTS